MEERILLYESPEYGRDCRMYQNLQSALQGLADGLNKLKLTPTIELLKRLFNGESVESEVAKKNVEDTFKDLPHSILNTLRNAFEKEQREDYQQALYAPLREMEKWQKRYAYDYSDFWRYVSVNAGVVSISDECFEQIDKWHRVYVDTEIRRAVYDKWLKLLEAKKEFDTIVKAAPKRKPTANEKLAGVDGKYLIPMAAPAQFSLVKVGYDGEMVLNGENFDYFQ